MTFFGVSANATPLKTDAGRIVRRKTTVRVLRFPQIMSSLDLAPRDVASAVAFEVQAGLKSCSPHCDRELARGSGVESVR
jgi:hypothetical protein